MRSNSSSPVGSWVLFTLASLAIIHALGESFGPPGIVAGLFALSGAAILLRRLVDPLRMPADFVPKRSGRKPPPDDADGSAPVTAPLRPRPVLTGGAAKAIPSELR